MCYVIEITLLLINVKSISIKAASRNNEVKSDQQRRANLAEVILTSLKMS